MKNRRITIFDDYEVDPSEKVWKGIDERLPLKGKNRRWLLWLFSLVFLLAGAWFLLKKENEGRNFFKAETALHSMTKIEPVTGRIPAGENNSARPTINNYDKTLASNTGNTKPITKISGVSGTGSSAFRNQPRSNQTNNLLGPQENLSDGTTFPTPEPGNPVVFLPALKITLNEISSAVPSMTTRREEEKKHCILSPWSVFTGAWFVHSATISKKDVPGEEELKLRGHESYGLHAGLTYEAGPRISLSGGIGIFTAGEEIYGMQSVVLKGPPDDPGTSYSIVSNSGNISVNSEEFNNAYYDSPDSTLFPPSAQLILGNEPSKNLKIRLRQEFDLLEIPLSIRYKPFEKRVTPFAGVTLSTIFVLKKRVFLNDADIRYQYENAVASQVFTVGILAGASLTLSRKFSFFAEGFYKKGLNTLINNENSGRPVYTGISAGISYRLSSAAKGF